MRTPSLPELRRFLGRALLAAPLALGACTHAEAPKQQPPPADAHVVRMTPPDAAAAISVAPPDAAAPDAIPLPPDAAPLQHGKCLYDPPDITGCGGAEVRLHSTLADCGLAKLGSGDDLSQQQCARFCNGFDTRSCHVYEGRAGFEVFCDAAHPCMGRLASDGDVAGARHADAALDHLALARRMETQSVAAFRELAIDLARWNAPAELVARAKQAARDEARHAAAMTRLLRTRGVAPERIERTRAPGFASLFALALHNEREGTVGETWGALVAMHQAVHAHDADVRDEMRAIADEETAHAALSFAIADWVRTQLSADENAALDRARAEAFASLRTEAPRPEAAAHLGWPSSAMRAELAPLFS